MCEYCFEVDVGIKTSSKRPSMVSKDNTENVDFVAHHHLLQFDDCVSPSTL